MELPFYDIEVLVKNPGWKKDLPEYEKICRTACTAALNSRELYQHASDTEISIMLTNNKEIQKLNKTFRKINKPTNVLSFPSENLTPSLMSNLKTSSPLVLGDIILALETIKKEAKEQGKKLENHVTHLIAHSTLHLLGYDHEKSEDAEIMEALEIRILEELGIANPYEIMDS